MGKNVAAPSQKGWQSKRTIGQNLNGYDFNPFISSGSFVNAAPDDDHLYWEPYEEGEPGPPLTDEEWAGFPPPQQTATIAEWAENPLVRRVLTMVGPPDGTQAWRLRFMGELLGFTEAVAAAKKQLRIPLNEVVELADGQLTFNNRSAECQRDHSYNEFITKSGLTIEQAARFCNVEPLRIAAELCPSNPEGLLRAETLLLESDLNNQQIAAEAGVHRWAVARHAERLGFLNGPNDEVRARCCELREQGLTYREIAEVVRREFRLLKFDPSTACKAVKASERAA